MQSSPTNPTTAANHIEATSNTQTVESQCDNLLAKCVKQRHQLAETKANGEKNAEILKEVKAAILEVAAAVLEVKAALIHKLLISSQKTLVSSTQPIQIEVNHEAESNQSVSTTKPSTLQPISRPCRVSSQSHFTTHSAEKASATKQPKLSSRATVMTLRASSPR